MSARTFSQQVLLQKPIHFTGRRSRAIAGLFGSIFWEQGFDKVCKNLESLNCLSSSMCNFEKEDSAGFCGHPRPKHDRIALILFIL
jgi:hypothetical protein